MYRVVGVQGHLRRWHSPSPLGGPSVGKLRQTLVKLTVMSFCSGLNSVSGAVVILGINKVRETGELWSDSDTQPSINPPQIIDSAIIG